MKHFQAEGKPEDYNWGYVVGQALKAGEDIWIKAPKPEPKIIDLSMMVGSDVDMEFSDSGDKNSWVISKLTNVDILDPDYGFMSKQFGLLNECRIRQDHWHSWQGGDCPLPEGLIIEIKRRGYPNIIELTDYKNFVSWYHNKHQDSRDIIAFKVIGLCEGWKYE